MKKADLIACPLSQWQIHYFTDIRRYLFRIQVYLKDQLRHIALQTEELLYSSDFHWQTAIFRPVKMQPITVLICILSSVYIQIHSISYVNLCVSVHIYMCVRVYKHVYTHTHICNILVPEVVLGHQKYKNEFSGSRTSEI